RLVGICGLDGSKRCLQPLLLTRTRRASEFGGDDQVPDGRDNDGDRGFWVRSDENAVVGDLILPGGISTARRSDHPPGWWRDQGQSAVEGCRACPDRECATCCLQEPSAGDPRRPALPGRLPVALLLRHAATLPSHQPTSPD